MLSSLLLTLFLWLETGIPHDASGDQSETTKEEHNAGYACEHHRLQETA